MYCGHALPQVEGEAGVGGQDRAEKARRARELLDGLKPEARAMMPPEVIAKLEADAAWSEGDEEEPAPAPPVKAATDLSPRPSPPSRPASPPLVRQTGPRLVYSAREETSTPSRAPAPAAAPPPVLDLPSHSIADLPPANQEEGRGGYEATLLEALGRGGGPFGPRKAPWRMMLLPSPAYREGLPWLRSRLARALGMDLYTASQQLQRTIPTCVAVADTRDELDGPAESLREGEIDVVVLQRREWARGRLPRLVADVLDLGEDPLLFTLLDGEPLAVPRRTIHTALLAEIRPIRDSVQIERNRFGLPKKIQRPGLEDRFTPYIAVDLLLDDDPRPLRFRSSERDFAALLGEQVQIAATLNMRRLVQMLALPDRELAIDEGFRRVQVMPGPQEREEAGGMKPGTVPRRAVDFTEYSLLRALSLHPL